MSNRRHGTSNVPSSIVQIAFDSNPTPHHCGYCNTNGSCTAGVVASTMLVDDYQLLMDRGWRKCGTYYYKALMKKTCCPLYTIRCDANNFEISRSQRRVIQNMNRFINENIKPGEKTLSTPPKVNKITLNDWIKTGLNTNAIQLIRHILTNDTPPSDEFLNRLKSRQKRWYKKLLKLKTQNKLSLETDIHLLIKRFNRIQINSLEQLLEFNDKPKNKLEFRLIRSYPPSDEFTHTLTESHSVYERYQMAIHGDSKSECSLSQFKRFLCQSSLQRESPRIPPSNNPSCGYGCFHLQYYLNEKIIACGVIDILPSGISSVYFYYEPDLGFLKLGVYSALKEIELTRRLTREIPDIKYYYLGFYVHTCVKMRYKGQYKPSYLLCPETYTWHRIEKCIPLLNSNKYARFELDLTKVDENEESNIEHLKLRVNHQIMTPLQLQAYNENYFFYIIDRFITFAKFVGRICTNRIIIDLS